MALLLAPMEGLLDSSLRDVLTRVGGIDRCVSEFIRVTNTLLPVKAFLRVMPELLQGGRTPAGVPVRGQLLGSDPACLADNAARLASLGPAGVDLNFGCPAKVVNRHGGGAALLDEPEQLHRIMRAVRGAVPAGMVVSAKMRLGVDDPSRAVECAQALVAGGAEELVVHARTKRDGYRPPAYWEYIAQVRDAVAVPVIANGEVWNVADAARCRQLSGCQTLMLGRGMVSNPGLALEILAAGAGSRMPQAVAPALPWSQVLRLLLVYTQVIQPRIEPRHQAGRIKQWLFYLRRHHPEAEAAHAALRCINDPRELTAALAQAARSLEEEERRIDHHPVQADGPVQVRAGDPPGGADAGDALTRRDPLAHLHLGGVQVAVHREQAAAVVEPDGVAVEEVVADIDHLAGRRAEHGRADRRGDVHAAVRIARLAIEDTAQAEGAGAAPLGG
jgi:tRNA-dihydrouridine synthase C